MLIKEFIESGILEQYVLGLTSDNERSEVERMVNAHPEIKTALEEIENSLETYAQLNAQPLPEHLAKKILNTVDSIQNDDADLSKPISQTKPGFNWPVVVLSGLFIFSIISLFLLNQRNQSIQQKLDQTEAEMQIQLADCDNQKERLDQVEAQLRILRDASFYPVILKGTPKAPEAIAAVYWDEQNKQVYLDVRNLPPPPADKQYQLWAIVDGNPVDMEVFEVAGQTPDLIERSFSLKAGAFAITLEKRGGSPTPNLDELYVIGEV